MKVIVTGGAGFIGANIVSALLERGYNVSVFEKTSKAFVIPMNFCLDDLGSWESLWKVSEKDLDVKKHNDIMQIAVIFLII